MNGFLSATNNGGITQDLDYLFIYVSSDLIVPHNKELENEYKSGIFIFPVEMLVEKGIISSTYSRGKTGFRVFPPWSDDRGLTGTKIFSNSGKKTQQWRLPYYFSLADKDLIDEPRLLEIMRY